MDITPDSVLTTDPLQALPVSTTKKRVAIVGAGISGLAHADVLTRCGFECVLFERAPKLGGVWAHTYPGVTLQNNAAGYHLSSFPWPFPPDLHPTGTQILRYLDALVAARGFDVRLQHEVVSAREREGGWDVALRITRPEGEEERTERFDHLLVSIGQYTEGKHRLNLPGEEEFPGRVITERELDDLALFDGARVAVVGFGKSALDMATFAAPRAKAVHHVFRTPRWTIPRTVFGVHFSKLLFNRFSSIMMPSWAHPSALERLLHRKKWVVRGFWTNLQNLFAFLARRQARGHGEAGEARLAEVLPDHGLVTDLRSAAALVPDNYYELIGRGTIQPHRGKTARLSAEGLHLANGQVIAADVVVLSVGSKSPSFPFLAPELRALLEGEPDGVQLYRHVVHPRIPSLAFAGYNHGFLHIPAAEVGALWLAALWQGKLELPPVEEMESAVEHVRTWKRQNITFEPSRSCAVSTRFQQYLDIMLADLGVSPYRKLPNPLAEIFAPYEARDYAGVVDEFLAHSPERRYRPSKLRT